MKAILKLFVFIILFWSCNPNADKANTSKNKEQNLTEETKVSEKSDVDEKQNEAEEENELSDDKIQSLKVAYYTKELDLSKQEAEKFWPIHNKHTAIYKNLGDTEWDSIKKGLREVDTYDEDKAEQLLTRYKSYLNKRLANRLSYIEELETVISPKKIMLLKHAEYNFNKKLLKQYRSGESTTK